METGAIASRRRPAFFPGQAAATGGAVHDPSDALAPSGPGASACEFCLRPWFGLVTYCPYCGHKPAVKTAHQEPQAVPEKALPPVQEPPVHADAAAPPESNSGSSIVFKIAVAGLTALLVLWIAMRFLAPRAGEGVLPQPAMSTLPITPSAPDTTSSGVAARDAAEVPSNPRPTGAVAGPAAVTTPVTASVTAPVPPPATGGALCSPASEQAGLCQSRK